MNEDYRAELQDLLVLYKKGIEELAVRLDEKHRLMVNYTKAYLAAFEELKALKDKHGQLQEKLEEEAE